jgi:hypothetical protein
MRLLALVGFVLMGASAALAQGVRVDAVDIVDKGIYVITPGEQTVGANIPSGTITAVPVAKNVQATTTIPGKLGVEFGFRYIAVGAPAGALVTLDFVYTYPAPGLRDPAEAKPILESRFSRIKPIGETVYLGYGLENAWEVVPGTWTFEIWYQGKKMAAQAFTVTR